MGISRSVNSSGNMGIASNIRNAGRRSRRQWVLRTGAAAFAAAVLGGGLAISLGIGGGDTAHNVAPGHHSLAEGGVISTNGVRPADGGVISSDGIKPGDGGVIHANGVRPADGGVISANAKVVVKGQHGIVLADNGVIDSNGIVGGDNGVIHSDDDGTITAD